MAIEKIEPVAPVPYLKVHRNLLTSQQNNSLMTNNFQNGIDGSITVRVEAEGRVFIACNGPIRFSREEWEQIDAWVRERFNAD